MNRSVLAAALLALPLLHAAAAGAEPGPAPRAARAARPAARYDAIVDAGYKGAEGAVIKGTPRFRLIGDAVKAAPETGTAPFVVRILNGRYREKVLVDRPNVHLVGEAREGVMLSWDDNADTKGPDGKPLGTRGSWTLKIVAPGFSLEHMAVENSFDYAANYAKANEDSTKVKNAQALAIALGQGSDRAVFRDCLIAGNQDTLFPDAGRSYYQHCTIIGGVDFIFGAGIALFQDCDIISQDRGTPKNNGYIAAPSTPETQPYGLVFLHDRLLKATPSMAPGSVFLGRPWHPSAASGISSSAVFIDCWMDDHIAPEGWTRMSSVDAGGTRIWYEPRDARFFEYRSSGPGAAANPARRQLTKEEAEKYTVEKVLGGWKP